MKRIKLNLFYNLIIGLCFSLFSCSPEEITDTDESVSETKSTTDSSPASFCKKFRTGKFAQVKAGMQLNVDIERTETQQIERSSTGVHAYDVTWENDCYYICELKETTNPDWVKFIGRKYHIQIVSFKGDTYQYKCWIQNTDFSDTGSIAKMAEL